MSQMIDNTLGAAEHDDPLPLAPPPWAGRSIREDGGVTHEVISPVKPHVRFWSRSGWTVVGTDVSLSAVDQHTDAGWSRAAPTIQIEGGSYTLESVRQLRDIIDALLVVADDGPADDLACDLYLGDPPPTPDRPPTNRVGSSGCPGGP